MSGWRPKARPIPSRGRLAEDVERVPFSWSMAIFSGAIIGLVLVIAIGFIAGCYPRPPVNPPSCAQDPTQDWCAPAQPILFTAHDGGGQ